MLLTQLRGTNECMPLIGQLSRVKVGGRGCGREWDTSHFDHEPRVERSSPKSRIVGRSIPYPLFTTLLLPCCTVVTVGLYSCVQEFQYTPSSKVSK